MTKKYAMVGHNVGGKDFRTIARHMTKRGDSMNHATARNILHRAMTKIGQAIADEFAPGMSEERLSAMIADPLFQEGCAEIVQDLYTIERQREKGRAGNN